jgi:hypothetical protein
VWTPPTVSQMVHLTIKGMTCTLNTLAVVEYILSPFGLEIHIFSKQMTAPKALEIY